QRCPSPFVPANWFIRGAFSAIRSKLSAGAHVYVFIDWRQTPNVYGMLESCGYRVNHCLVWAKTHFGMGAYWRNQHENIVFASLGTPAAMLDRGRGSVIMHPNVPPQARVHPTEKPVGLIGSVIKAAPGQTILDPFMGSGSTGVAAVKEGRHFVGIEIERRYFDLACKRIEEAYAEPRLFTTQPKQEQAAGEPNLFTAA
ncbi:MAG TPA: site-specific DNA-methyltransferase, partial [Gemmataceae bacterium]|nr:site-specific DNA-methyltransferase [Gemmataceae bacterium]